MFLDISSTIRFSKVGSQACKTAQLAIQEAQKAALIHRAHIEGTFNGFSDTELENVFSSPGTRSLLQHNVVGEHTAFIVFQATRWNGKHIVFERLIEVEEAVHETLKLMMKPYPTDDDWRDLKLAVSRFLPPL
jgi:hypothetical protein